MVYMGVSTEMCKGKPSTKGWPRPNQCCLNTIETLPTKTKIGRWNPKWNINWLQSNLETDLPTLLSLSSQHPHKRLRPRHRKARQRAEGFVQSRVAPYVERGSTWLPSEWVGLHRLNPEDPLENWDFTSQDGIQLAIQLQNYAPIGKSLPLLEEFSQFAPQTHLRFWRKPGDQPEFHHDGYDWGTSCNRKYMAYVSVWNWGKNLESTDSPSCCPFRLPFGGYSIPFCYMSWSTLFTRKNVDGEMLFSWLMLWVGVLGPQAVTTCYDIMYPLLN